MLTSEAMRSILLLTFRTCFQEADLQSVDEAKNASAGLAASLSATVASRARYFESLSRRRVLRLEVEADLRAARAKLDTLLAGAVTAPQTNDASDDNRLNSCGSDGYGGGGQTSPQPGSDIAEVSQKQAAVRDDNEDASASKRQKGIGSRSANAVSPKRVVGFEAQARGRPGRGQGSETRQAGNRGGRSRGHAVAPVDVPTAPPGNKRRSPAALETTTKRRPPPVKVEKSPPSCTEGGAETTNSSKSNNPNKFGGAPNPRQQIASTQEERLNQRESSGDRTGGPDDTENTTRVDDSNKRECSEEAKDKVGASEAGSREEQPMIKNDDAPSDKGALSDQDGDKAIGDQATAAGTEAKEHAPSGGLGQARSPRTPPQKPKVVAKSAAQLRRPPNSLRGGRTKGGGGRTKGGGPSSQAKNPRKREEEKPGNPSPVADESQSEGKTGAISDDGDEGSGQRCQELKASTTTVADNENATSTSETLPYVKQVDEAQDTTEGNKTGAPKKNDRQAGAKRRERQARVAPRQPRGQGTREDIAPTSTGRSPEKTKRAKPALRPTRTGGVRADSVLTKAPPDGEVSAPEVGDAQRPGELQADDNGGSGVEPLACDGTTAKKSDGDVKGEVSGRGVTEQDTDTTGNETAGAGVREEVPRSGVNPKPVVTSVQDDEAIGGGCEGNRGIERAREREKEGSNCGPVVASGQSTVRHDVRVDDLLPRRVVDLAESLKADVNRLRLEKAELEDTIAQLNVAAAQLYFVEYDRMKVGGETPSCVSYCGMALLKALEQNRLLLYKAPPDLSNRRMARGHACLVRILPDSPP